MDKITIKNMGSRKVAVRGVDGMESVAPQTERTIAIDAPLSDQQKAALRVAGCELTEAAKNAPVTKYYENTTGDKKKPEPSDEERRADLAKRAEVVGLAYGETISLHELDARVTVAEADFGKTLDTGAPVTTAAPGGEVTTQSSQAAIDAANALADEAGKQVKEDAAKNAAGKDDAKELAAMKVKADKLEIVYAPNIGLESLTKRVNEAEGK